MKLGDRTLIVNVQQQDSPERELPVPEENQPATNEFQPAPQRNHKISTSQNPSPTIIPIPDIEIASESDESMLPSLPTEDEDIPIIDSGPNVIIIGSEWARVMNVLQRRFAYTEVSGTTIGT